MFVFHAGVLLFAPSRYLPLSTFGGSSLVLLRRPPVYVGRRLVGLALFIGPGLILWNSFRHQASSSGPEGLTFGESTFPAGSLRWDLLGLGIFALCAGYVLLVRAKWSARTMLRAD